jgi:hypothetical protein
MRNAGKVVTVFLLVAVVLGVVALLLARSGAIVALTDPEDITPAVVSDANLNGLWYGPLDITRFDDAGHQAEQLSEAFYLKLNLRSDSSITGTYTTCSFTAPVKQAGLDEYTMQDGVLNSNGKLVNLYLFAPMYGTISGDTLSLRGQRYVPHGDAITDEYASTLHKVADSTYLSACHVIPG